MAAASLARINSKEEEEGGHTSFSHQQQQQLPRRTIYNPGMCLQMSVEEIKALPGDEISKCKRDMERMRQEALACAGAFETALAEFRSRGGGAAAGDDCL